MSLTVNGVTIPETNGAIKVGATNVQKVVVNNTTVWEVPQGYTISWSAPLALYGLFINNTSPSKSSSIARGDKQIRYTKPDGSIAVANPYRAGSIIIKKGTRVYLDMFSGLSGTNSYVYWRVNDTNVNIFSSNRGKLCSCDYILSGSCTLVTFDDTQTQRSEGYCYNWGVRITY